MISQYWVGQIPKDPISFQVRDGEGRFKNLSEYSDIRVKLLGSDNEEVDTYGSTIDTTFKYSGTLIFHWPTDRSVFTKRGDYVLQLELSGNGFKDYTTTHTIRVRELGRVN